MPSLPSKPPRFRTQTPGLPDTHLLSPPKPRQEAANGEFSSGTCWRSRGLMGNSVPVLARSFGKSISWENGDICRWNSPTIRQCFLQQKTWSASDINPGAGRSSSLSSGGDADSRRRETMFINDLQWGPVTPHYRRPSRASASLFIFRHQSSSAEPVIRTCIDSWSICFVRLRRNTAGYVYTLKRLSYERVCVCGGGCTRVPGSPAAMETCLRDSFPLGPPWQPGMAVHIPEMSWGIWYHHSCITWNHWLPFTECLLWARPSTVPRELILVSALPGFSRGKIEAQCEKITGQDQESPVCEVALNCCFVSSLSCVQLFRNSIYCTRLAPLSMAFPRQEYWSGLPFPSPEDLPNQGSNPCLLHRQVDSLLLSQQGSPTLNM